MADLLFAVKELEVALKHLPGKHEQETHAGGMGGAGGKSGAGKDFPNVPDGFSYDEKRGTLSMEGLHNSDARYPHRVEIEANRGAKTPVYGISVYIGTNSNLAVEESYGYNNYNFDSVVSHARKVADRQYLEPSSSNAPEGRYQQKRSKRK